MKTRTISLAAAAIVLTFAADALAADPLWERFKETFITRDGRVVDIRQDRSSHSEGQGYAMIMAVAFGDRGTFDTVWRWSRNNIQARRDGLLAWRWGKRGNGEWAVIDYNNATDGDILAAYALLKAADKWGDEKLREAGRGIVKTMREKLAVEWEGKTFLLPSYYGFSGPGGHVLNPSYVIFPAFRRFASEDDRGFWEKVYADGLGLVSASLFGMKKLPADWVRTDGSSIKIHSAKSDYFGYDAVRVVLHLLAAEETGSIPEGIKWLLEFYGANGYIPAWVDLEKDAISLGHASAGVYAIFAATAERLGGKETARKLHKEARVKLDQEKDNYYSFSLYLLAVSGALR